MSLTANGVTTTTEKDCLQYEKYFTKIGRKKVARIQWDYRDSKGVLHSGIATSIDKATEAAKEHGYQIPYSNAK
jgi:hypothetical protein